MSEGEMNPVRRITGRLELARRILREDRRGLYYGRHELTRSGDLATTSETPESMWLETYFDGRETGPAMVKWRHYFPIYERHLSKFRGRAVNVVEIGVYSGGSLGMWKSYFGDRSTVYGIDIVPDCRSFEGDGVHIFIGDQADPAFWRDFIAKVPQIDIVIDDGGHEAQQQIATLEAILPVLRPGGVYICEDLLREFNPFSDYLFGLSRNLNSWLPKTEKRPGREPSPVQRFVEGMHLYPFLAVIERRDTARDRLIPVGSGSEWQPDSFWESAEHTPHAP
jgi:Methyltransferase domain